LKYEKKIKVQKNKELEDRMKKREEKKKEIADKALELAK
jgi:hypothetical protein